MKNIFNKKTENRMKKQKLLEKKNDEQQVIE